MRLDTGVALCLCLCSATCYRGDWGADWREIAVRVEYVSTMNKEKCSVSQLCLTKTGRQPFNSRSPSWSPRRAYTYIYVFIYQRLFLLLFLNSHLFQVAGYLSVHDSCCFFDLLETIVVEHRQLPNSSSHPPNSVSPAPTHFFQNRQPHEKAFLLVSSLGQPVRRGYCTVHIHIHTYIHTYTHTGIDSSP